MGYDKVNGVNEDGKRMLLWCLLFVAAMGAKASTTIVMDGTDDATMATKMPALVIVDGIMAATLERRMLRLIVKER
jgi:hypothetical protein